MHMESIRYFDGEKHIEYSNTQEDVDFISFEKIKSLKLILKTERA